MRENTCPIFRNSFFKKISQFLQYKVKMEQDLCIDIGKFDPSEVDLAKPADTVQEYIKQVIVTRDNLPDVAVAQNVDRSKFKTPTCLVPTDVSASAVCSFTPPTEWSQLKVIDFFIKI